MKEPNTSGGKARRTNAKRIEGLLFRLWAVFKRGWPMNRTFATAQGPCGLGLRRLGEAPRHDILP